MAKAANGETLKVIYFLKKGGYEVNHYVYIWYNKETREVFYVGKGSRNRANRMQNRNKYFINYKNKYDCDYKIIINNIESEEAFEIERYLVYECRKLNLCKTNIADGGFGGNGLKGSQNPMYGRPWWNSETPEEKIMEWKSKLGNKGEKNAQYGVSPKERMSEDTYDRWLNAQKTRDRTGSLNPNYGNRILSKFYKENPEIAKLKQGRPAFKNGRCVPVSLYDSGHHLIKEFRYFGECSEYLIKNGITNATIASVSITISEKKKNGLPYKGFYFK